jgi:drug/metabolite transporter (DMT)-like permease
LWASGTVLARLVLREVSYVTLTALRILIALPFLWIVALPDGAVGEAVSGIGAAPARLIASALVPGLFAVLLFYRGLRGTKACYAVLAEFMYPAAALVGNWMVLGTLITPLQGLGCALLIGTILLLSWNPTRVSAPRLARAGRGPDEAAVAFAD